MTTLSELLGPSPGAFYDYIKVSDRKSSGTNGGGLTLGAWRTRTINTEDADTGGHASIATNQITLQPGTYICNIRAPGFQINSHKCRLQNITDGVTLIDGENSRCSNADIVMSHSFALGRFTLAVAKTLEVQHRCIVTNGTSGGGSAVNVGNDEVYTVAEFCRERVKGEAPSNVADYIKVSDVKATTVDGGTFTSGAWRTRDINTEDSDTGGDCSISANQVTLQPGTYVCKGYAWAYRVENHQCRLQNITDGSTELGGTNGRTDSTGSSGNPSVVNGRFTISTAKTFELQHRCSNTRSTDGFGDANSFGGNEIYSTLEFWKVD